MNINKDTLLCMSLAARPGNFGTRFHNYLYEQLNLNYIYKAFTTQDLPAAIGGIRALGIRGCAVSMPFKEACIPYLDELDPSAKAIDSVNTIVNTDGYLKAYNTDYIAIAQLIKQHGINPQTSFVLRGSGGMAKAVAAAFHDAGFHNGTIVARNEETGRRLADLYGYAWQEDDSTTPAALLINVTPVGMAGGAGADALSFSEQRIAQAEIVFDVVALPARTPLIQAAQAQNKPVITGAEVIAIQALEQFVLYTGVRPDHELVQRAAAHARS
ncbi:MULTISPECIES: shikimate 5-dehydrogenase [Sodalis]|jgi:shikimate dehydrogenase|uniref:Shikimate dehydrogenase n=1 Tax=Sodalis ligni TaxID=2697027 RepID=A0A4R1NAD8_9GAMM|nr:shikimate 5-dehydrogenase [Sodalis ligni]TCL04375.1 shikimate dehydrogenase [Sodalis ligni]